MTGIPTAPVVLPVLTAPVRLRRRVRVSRPVLVVGIAGLLLAALAGAVVAFGLSFFVVESPSMGRAAPVGTLIVSQRVDPRDVRVGDVVTYRSPDGPGTVTHRVVGRTAGGFRLRGDINGAADARTVHPSMIVGRAVAVLPGVGWAVRLAPWLMIGATSVWLLTLPITAATTRAGLRVVGICAVATTAIAVLDPFTGWTVLSRVPQPGGLMATVVPTGLLPVRLSAQSGGSIDAVPGQVVQLLLPADTTGRVVMTSGPALDVAGWIVLVLLCLLPLIGVLTVGLPGRDPREA